MTKAGKKWGQSSRSEPVTLAFSSSSSVCPFALPLPMQKSSHHTMNPTFSCTHKGLQRRSTKGFLLWKKVLFSRQHCGTPFLCLKRGGKQIFLPVNPRKLFSPLVQIRTFHVPKKEDWSSHPIWWFVSNASEPHQVTEKNSPRSPKEKKNRS